ncbi:uncharacterized protein LOC113794569 [Dermatophagoides pteronyssinus]|uniref:uncharacterized protein LOC113794569 n=1 Tax=Dermatophagoides pteronyssinus TaxID=6956 RepID=UPI003F666D65
MMKSNDDEEFHKFFDSIGLDSWIEPLKNVGVSSLKFLYINFNDIINDDNDDEILNSLRTNRLHVKIILKRLKDKFDSNNNDLPNVNTSILNTSTLNTSNVNTSLSSSSFDTTQVETPNKRPKRKCAKKSKSPSQCNGLSTPEQANDSTQKSEHKFPQTTVMQASILNANIEGIYYEEKLIPKPNGGHEEFIKIFVPEPVEPKKQRFLDDWHQYGQIRFFDAANYQPNLPQILHEFMAKVIATIEPIPQKEFDQMKELLSMTLFQDLQHYFIWRLPTRFLHTVCDRLIQMYPMWDDGSPTKTETIKKRILDKYMHFRRYKIAPDWVEHRYIMLKNEIENGVLPNGGKKRGRLIPPKPPAVDIDSELDTSTTTTTTNVVCTPSIMDIADTDQSLNITANESVDNVATAASDDAAGDNGCIVDNVNNKNVDNQSMTIDLELLENIKTEFE